MHQIGNISIEWKNLEKTVLKCYVRGWRPASRTYELLWTSTSGGYKDYHASFCYDYLSTIGTPVRQFLREWKYHVSHK